MTLKPNGIIFCHPSPKSQFQLSKFAGTFYLLRNGKDVPNCGSIPAEACESITYLLSVFYKKYRHQMPTLELTTDKSFTINKDYQVR